MSANNKKISTGVSELDPILGGLLIGDNVVLYDDAGSLASPFCMNFLKISQERKKPFIYVSFDRSPRNLLEKLGPLADNDQLTILDCFTHGKGKGVDIFFKFYEDKHNKRLCKIINVSEPHNPNKVMEAFLEVHSKMKPDVRFVFESLTGMQELWEGEDQIGTFYSHTCPRLYELNAIGYWIMEKDAHSKRLKASINQIAQVAIELSLKRGKTSLSILKAENRDLEYVNTPYLYSAKGTGITFNTRKYTSSHVEMGNRLKELRMKRGMSQAELARFVGVTPSNISQIESNHIYPSLPALFKIAEILSVDMGFFFQELSGLQSRAIFCGADAAEIQLPDMPKKTISAKLLAPLDDTAKVEPYLIEIQPKKELPAHFFAHKGEEIGYVLSGKLQIQFGNNAHTIRSGDVIHLTTEIPSRWKNPGSGLARLFWLKIR